MHSILFSVDRCAGGLIKARQYSRKLAGEQGALFRIARCEQAGTVTRKGWPVPVFLYSPVNGLQECVQAKERMNVWPIWQKD
jgi:hypothetical protein